MCVLVSTRICISLAAGEANAFESACPYWGPKVREPAEEICALKCTGKPPQNLTCTSDKDCTDPTHPTCVVQSDGNYAQCITCDSTQFQRDCPEWNRDKFLPRAESKCGIECTGAGGLACHTDDDCTDVGAPTCVVQKDGYYAQCVTCESTQFQKDCVDWDVAQFLPAAEARCHETCNRMWWDSSFSTVDK